ncbi:MAG: sodium:solute symporter, partial [Flavobacteriales bacterium]
VLQVVVLLGGTAIAFAMMISGSDGGLNGFIDINLEYGKFSAIDWKWDMTMPVIWVFMLNQLMTQANFPSDQVMVQRVLTTPDVKSARRSYILLGLIVVPGTLLFHLLGSGLFSFFHSHPGLLSPTMDNIQVFPIYIVEVLPAGITGLLIAALFAASMSTLDSGINSVTTVLLSDFYKRFNPKATETSILSKAKYTSAIVGIAATVIALLMARFDIKSMFDLWMNILALIGGGFGGVFLLGIFTRRANAKGVIIGAICSIVATVLVKYYTEVHFMLYTTVAVGTCVIAGWLTSLLFHRPAHTLEKLTIYTLQR